jgi:hypothetical protein
MTRFLAAVLLSLIASSHGLAQKLEFNRDIRPILSDHCFQCHGPDRAKRKAKLRLDTEEGVLSVLNFGKLLDSELFRRVTTTEETERMPPKRFDRPLNERQVQLLKRWIEEGAQWQKHWAFIPPVRPPLPEIRNPKSEIRNGIDVFLLARLQKEGLNLSPEADRTTLLRRVTLDLTGLPPTPAEVETFQKDDSPNAYEKVVDRLLASPRFGERMAIDWLDAARYADSNGYQSDGERFMWRWRDWVLEAINSNMPFDRFTIEQLAGDLLSRPTLEQKIATGFNRNHRGNGEGGIIPEEYAVEYVVDRVDTTMAVWQGLTIGCARCHDHKYDPFSQKEYYQLFSFFNNVPEWGRAIKYGNSPPMIKAPTRQEQAHLRRLKEGLEQAELAFDHLKTEVVTAQERWEKTIRERTGIDWTITDGLLAHYPLDGTLDDGTGKHKPGLMREGKGKFDSGRIGKAAAFDGRCFVDAGDVANFGFYDKFSLSAWVQLDGKEGGVIVARTSEALRGEGYTLRIENGRVQLNLVKRWLDDALRVETETTLQPGTWHHIVATYDGSRVARGATLFFDGVPQRLKVVLDELNQSFDNPAPLRIGAGGGDEDRFHGLIDDVRIYGKCLTATDVQVLSVAESVSDIARQPHEKHSLHQQQKLRAAFLATALPPPIKTAYQLREKLRQEQEEFLEGLPTVMVMDELPRPRDAFILIRGQYDKRGEKVTPAVPATLTEKAAAGIKDRLAFARWLVSPDNPLTSRVMVNRYWHHFFGTGLVKTAEDFGSQGEAPSHPELLDWLATEFVRTEWDAKAIQRLIVTSAAYRQSSRVTPELMQRDPANRLLGRAPRLRLPAEVIRDQALFTSGLLVEHVGGPSVKPYQPTGLWEELAGVPYKPDRGEALYRRSVYTFWKRTVTPPNMATFDATAREACTVNRARTNTPLQALTLLNDVQFVEASRVLAERLMCEGKTAEERLRLAFLRIVGRRPGAGEVQVLSAGLERHRAHYRRHPEAAKKLLEIGAFPRNGSLDVGEVAALAAIVGMILNLDEVVTRE